ncbi:MAG: FAD-dependent oxidoreductase, partial [Chloroflexi bacterium]|nr:FAD-dependent oxidoreductase [Chloroflexota bacterium]
MAKDYELLVVGGGLAGLTAGMFGARYGLKTGLIEQMMGGAQIINVENIENFPGFPQGIPGAELAPAVQEQAMNAGVEFMMAEVSGVSRDGPYKVVATDAGDHRAKAVIVAAGSTLRRLGIPGEEEMYGRGVSQCATCDGPLYMGQVVGVVGGGDSAADEA